MSAGRTSSSSRTRSSSNSTIHVTHAYYCIFAIVVATHSCDPHTLRGSGRTAHHSEISQTCGGRQSCGFVGVSDFGAELSTRIKRFPTPIIATPTNITSITEGIPNVPRRVSSHRKYQALMKPMNALSSIATESTIKHQPNRNIIPLSTIVGFRIPARIVASRGMEYNETFTPRQMHGALQGKLHIVRRRTVLLQAVRASLSCPELLSAQLCRVRRIRCR